MFERELSIQPGRSYFLLGPRGTGKSHWLRNRFPKATYLDLLNADLYYELLSHPSRLEQFAAVHDPDQFIIIDEIQKIPRLLDEVHRLIEEKRWHFILTGSSARKLRRGGANMLAGRALQRFMHPLTAPELGNKHDLSDSLQYGQLPAIHGHPDPKDYLRTYLQTYLREEVLQEGLSRNLPAFSRFLEAASYSQGQVLNISQVAQESNIPRKTVENYFSILVDILIARYLPAFTKRAKRKVTQQPKFYFFDVGVYRMLRPKGPLDSPEEIDGAALESLFFQEVSALNDNRQLDLEIFYWRTYSQLEVDFVLYGEQGLFAFEIKRKKQLTPHDLKGVKAFLEDYPMGQGYIFYGGSHVRQLEESIVAIPFAEGIRKLPEIFKSSQE